jgi:hypothetical protein
MVKKKVRQEGNQRRGKLEDPENIPDDDGDIGWTRQRTRIRQCGFTSICRSRARTSSLGRSFVCPECGP